MLRLYKVATLQRRLGLRVFSDSRSISTSVIDAYQQYISNNKLDLDQKQLVVVKLLDKFKSAIEKFDFKQFDDEKEASHPAEASTLQDKPQIGANKPVVGRIRGLYLYGPVGVGKTMVMDLFYQSCQIEQKRRVHFHQFMLNVHRSIHEHKQYLLAKYGRSRHIDLSPEHDSIRQVGYQIAAETKLLCFDEFQVTDICDALILTKLFDAMWSHGVVLVATSNRPPTDLYLDGVNRPDFLPFIERLQLECMVRKLDSGKDYRLLGYEQYQQQSTNAKDNNEVRFMSPMNATSFAKFRLAFNKEVSNRRGNGIYTTSNTIAAPEIDQNNHNIIRLSIQGNRYFSLSKDNAALDVGVCFIDFAVLCEMDRGAVDYYALCQYFQVVYLHGIPKLTRQQHDATRRFIILIDELYNHHVKLICLAEVNSPHEMYSTFTQPLLSKTEKDGYDEDTDLMQNSTEASESTQGESFETKTQLEGYGRNHSLPTARLKETSTIGQQEEINVMESELSSIKDLDFAFQRATSRVMEMITWQ